MRGIGGSWFVVVGGDGWAVEMETEAKLGLFCVKLVRCRRRSPSSTLPWGGGGLVRWELEPRRRVLYRLRPHSAKPMLSTTGCIHVAISVETV